MKTVFLRALEADDKAAALHAAIQGSKAALSTHRFEVDTASFAVIRGAPFACWVSEKLRWLFKTAPALEANGRLVRIGLTTHDDFRWVRLAWETGTPRFYVPFAKGGQFAPFYADVHLALHWANDGELLKVSKRERFRRGELTENNSRCWNESFYFRPGITWPRRTNGLSLRAMPKGCIFADKGPAVFVENENTNNLLALAAVTNSQAFTLLVSLQLARTELAQSYEVGLIQNTPVPQMNPTDQPILAALARRAWSLRRSRDTQNETSHAFILPALLQVTGDTLTARAMLWTEHVHTIQTELATIQTEIDDRCFDLYGIDEADRRAITEGFSGGTNGSTEGVDKDGDVDGDDDEEAGPESSTDSTRLVAELVSWAVGVAFGRFDVRLATGTRALSPENPFDPQPVCSPAMLTGEDSLPLANAPPGYPLAFSENGIMVDDPGHPHDLTTAVHAVFDVIFNARADAIWQEAAALLDLKEHDMRTWLSSSFFEHHLKHYSKSRRKAPIFWQFGTPSGRYSVWLYAHRLTRDSMFQLQNQVDGIVARKVADEERQLSRLIQDTSGNPSAQQRKETATQEAFIEELRTLLEEVKRVAPLWTPTIDDGVVLTMAPLWRLVPQHKTWQKELKGKWDELREGKYDWAHLAMHLWPERVVSNCGTDRSLAIAHGLEEVFWVEDADGKWQLRETPTRPVEEIVRERSSPAVKAGLKSLLEAPLATGKTSSKKRKGSRP